MVASWLARAGRATLLCAVGWAASGALAQTTADAQSPQRCVPGAASFHGVNPLLLEAVLRVESGLRPATVTTNSNGTVDVGMGGTNSIHFRELARYGIMPQHLLDACVATYVAAWHLRRAQSRFGNTWEGAAAYHSATPAYNWRYRVLLYNELVRMGVVRGAIQPVPRLTSAAAPAQPRSAQQPAAATGAMSTDGAATRQRVYGTGNQVAAAEPAQPQRHQQGAVR